nr:MAG TPA: N-acetylmuramoyl-L-alanine amidase [Bacteriophage sp.]
MKADRIKRKKGAALAAFFFALAIVLSAPSGAEAYQSVDRYVSNGHGYLNASYLVIHETANPGASAYNHTLLWARDDTYAVHHVMELDGSTVYNTVAENRLCWHVGNGNGYTIGIELAHATNAADFTKQWGEAVKWAGDELRAHGWDTSRLLSHYEAARRWGGSDHTDPNGYFRAYGKTWAEFKQAVAFYLGSGYVAPIAPTDGNGGTYQPPYSATRAKFPKSTGKSVNIHYALHNRYGSWNEAVTNFNDGNSEGFAGLPYGSHDMLIAWVDTGTLRYRVHTEEAGWLDWVQTASYGDSVNGMAGIWGQTVDGVQMYYITPDGDYKQVYYRSQDAAHAGYWGEVCDDGSTYGGDDYAGMYGCALDRLQCYVSDGTRR